VDDSLIVTSLEADQTRCIIYDPVMYAEFPPFHELFPGTAMYIKRNYALHTRMQDGRGVSWYGLVRRERARDSDRPSPPQGE
jgi:hypothetical protein